MPALSWMHHTLIQALLSRGPLSEKDFHEIFTCVTGKNPGNHHQIFNEYLLNINKELSFLQFELRGCRNQYDGKVFYGVVNNVSDEQSKLGTKYSVLQIAFYKAIIEATVQDAAAQGCISNIDALNLRLENQVLTATGSESQAVSSTLPPALRNFSISQKEKTLDELVKDQWLCSTTDGKIGLGVRSFLDLRSWFRSNEISPCEVCNEAGVKAELCQNETCTVRIHLYCLKGKFSQRKVEKVCPGCRTPWQYTVPKAEAADEENECNESLQSQLPPEPVRKRLRTNKPGAGDTARSDSSQASQSTNGLRRSTRSLSRLQC